MSEPIQFNGIGNLLVCTRCGRDAENPYEALKDHTILYNGRVPVAILCDACYLELEQSGQLDEEGGTVRLYP